MVLSLNASDDRGINVVRDQIKTFAGTRKLFSSGMKLVILDEADHMTNDAQFALRRVIEKYSSNARFCIICNYVSKIIPALQSRCTKFRFSPLDHANMLIQAKRTVEAEGLNIDADAVEMVVTLAMGDMRRVLNVLQACSMAYDHITVARVCAATGSPMPQDIENMLNWLFNENVPRCYELINNLQIERGVALADLVRLLGPWIGRLQMEPSVSCYLYDELPNLEHVCRLVCLKICSSVRWWRCFVPPRLKWGVGCRPAVVAVAVRVETKCPNIPATLKNRRK